MILPYELPHACETAEVAALLAELKPMARRALRSFVHQVEYGDLHVGEWLASPTCPVKLRRWRYLLADPAFQTALDAYRTALQRAELIAEQKAVAGSQRTLRLAAGRAAERLVEHAQADLGGLFKIVERWTDEPLPSQEILQEKVREDELGIKRKFYLVRQAVIDLARLADPRYSRQVRKFADSPRTGISIELYDAQRAVESILDRAAPETAAKGALGGEVKHAVEFNLSQLDDAELATLAQLAERFAGDSPGAGAPATD